jgi:hypothetical protein
LVSKKSEVKLTLLMSSTITGVVDDDVEVYPYELVISVKRANITGGGLPNSSYVEIYIDGKLFILIMCIEE